MKFVGPLMSGIAGRHCGEFLLIFGQFFTHLEKSSKSNYVSHIVFSLSFRLNMNMSVPTRFGRRHELFPNFEQFVFWYFPHKI